MRIRSKKNAKKSGKKECRSQQRGPMQWVAIGAMGALVAYSPFGSRVVSPACANDNRAAISANQRQTQTQSASAHRFDIPPGPLERTLNAFQNLTGLRAIVTDVEIGNINSPGVSGVYNDEQALKQILAGTGVVYRFTAPDAVTLEVSGPTASVEVTAGLPSIIASPKYTEPLLETPQSVTVVTRQTLEDQGATTLRDALRNVAGISLAAGEGGAQGDNLTIRGFTARNDIFLDGMRDFGSYYRDPFNFEQVEVLRGPSSVTFGRGSTGGVVNQAYKYPQSSRFISGDVNFGSDLTRRVTADINEPLERLGKGAAFRLNLMAHDSKVAGRDIAETRRFGIAPSLGLSLGATARLTLSYYRQSANDIPDYGIPWLFNGPAPVDRENYYGFKNANFLKTNVDIGTARLEHEFSGDISLRSQTRYAHYKRDAQISEARVPAAVTLNTPLESINVIRNQITVNSLETLFINQTDLTARFKTGFIRHTLVMGVEASRETSSPIRSAFTGVPVTSLLRPDTNQPFSGSSTITSRVNTVALSFGAYVIETMKLGEKLDLIGGARWDRFDADFTQSVAPILAFKRVDEMTSWRAAIVYKPNSNGSVYFDYGASFNPSAEALSLSASTANLEPEKNRTYEVGSKWELFSRKLSLRGALFRIEKLNAREPDSNNPLLNVLAGKHRVNGFEFEAQGNVTRRWQMLSSYAFMDSKLVKSVAFPLAVGSQLANAPRNTFSLWTNYELPIRLKIGGGGQFIDSRAASSTAPLDPATGLVRRVTGYWVFNAVAKYPLSERFDLQVNGFNLANKFYFDQIHPGHIVPGPGRSVLLGISFKF
jgi:catecholate siderophore receptor